MRAAGCCPACRGRLSLGLRGLLEVRPWRPLGRPPAVAGGVHCRPQLLARGAAAGLRDRGAAWCILLCACRSVVQPRRLLPSGLSAAPLPRVLASRRFLARVRGAALHPAARLPRPSSARGGPGLGSGSSFRAARCAGKLGAAGSGSGLPSAAASG